MKNAGYEGILERFKLYYPNLANTMVSWRPGSRVTIIAELSDGAKLEFHDTLGTIRTLRHDPGVLHCEEDWRKEFTYRLIGLMYELEMTRIELSEKTGISMSSIGKYISGRSTPSGWAVFRLAEALDCPVEYLMGTEVEAK